MNIRLLPFLLFCVLSFGASAQTNFTGLNYQAVVRNAAGDPVPNQAVSLRLHIQEGLITGYVETQSTTTDAQGQVSVVWGQGTPVGGSTWATFAAVPWSNGGTKTYQVYVDITGGSTYAFLGSGQFKSVPFALHALTSSGGAGWSLSGNDLVNTNTGNVGIGTSTPGSLLQLGTFGGATDRYLTIASEGGNLYRSGIRLRHFNDLNGYTIESDERGGTLGLNILDHEASAAGASVLFVEKGSRNVGIGTTTPGSSLQVGEFGGAVDRYITVATQGGNTQRSGIKLRHFNTDYGYTIESDERSASEGLNILEHFANNAGTSVMYIQKFSGNVGIGTMTPQSKLAVNGKLTCKEVDVTVTGFPDYVFREGYELMPLPEVKSYIKEHGRLPKMPSEAEVVKNGLSLGAMNVLLVEKVEELTLQMIANEERAEALRTELEALRKLVQEGLKK